ncbi:MAG TPA: hypothetical protein VF006_09985 [Longimicrobium sp.]
MVSLQEGMLMFTNKLTLDGDHSVLAGRDVIIMEQSGLLRRFAEQMAAIDARINTAFPQKILSPTKNNAFEPFSSERLVRSLVQVGIPVTAALAVAQELEPRLLEVAGSEDIVTTGHIRKAVSRTIYGMTTEQHTAAMLQSWGDIYSRRYGNPNERLRLLHRDGSEEDLDFKYLKHTLIPHLVDNILGRDLSTLKEGMITATAVEHIAEELMQQIKGLNLYAIRYKTLYNLAYDIAVQPPHPWFVESAYMTSTVAYELERAQAHSTTLATLLDIQDLAGSRHAALECIQHSCSAILGFYGAFLGAGYLGPIHQLLHVLKLPEVDGNPVLWEFCKIRQIEGDLAAIGESRMRLLQSLSKLAKHIHGVPDAKVAIIARNAIDLEKLATRLIHSRVDKVDMLVGQLRGLAAPGDILAVAKEVFLRVPGLKLAQTSWHETGVTLQQNIDNALFRNLLPRIVVGVCDISFANTDEVTLKQYLEPTMTAVREDPGCNSLILINSIAWDSECLKHARKIGERQWHIFLVCVDELLGIYDTDDRTGALSETLLNK